jgi:hypothetical protein
MAVAPALVFGFAAAAALGTELEVQVTGIP